MARRTWFTKRPSLSKRWVSRRLSASSASSSASWCFLSLHCTLILALLLLHRLITLLFSTLIGSAILSGLITTTALLLRFYWYKPHPTDHRKFVKDNVEAWLFWAAANVSISWGLALIVDIIPAVIRIVISIAWGHVSEVVKSRLELYNSVKGPIKPVLYAASGWVSWVILFDNIFKLFDINSTAASRAPYTERVRDVA